MDREHCRAFRLDRGPDDARSRVDEELEHHLELAAAELREEGWSPEEARREAERRFGDLEGRTRFLDELRQNLTYGIRSALKAPGYSTLVVLTLAFGIAATTTIFSLMNPYFFRPLPYGEAEELVHLQQVDPVTGWDRGRFSLPTVEDWRKRNRAFEGLAGYTYGGANLTGPEGAEAVTVSRVTPDLLDVLRIQPALGRGFRPDDGGPGADPVVLLSHGLWERRYLGDPGVLGRSISMDGVAHTVVGVMPPEFLFPFNGTGGTSSA